MAQILVNQPPSDQIAVSASRSLLDAVDAIERVLQDVPEQVLRALAQHRAELLRRTQMHLARAMRTRLAEDRVSLVHASRRLG